MSTHIANIKRGPDGRWRYHVEVLENHEKLEPSQGYTRRYSALRAVRANRPDVVRIYLWDRRGMRCTLARAT